MGQLTSGTLTLAVFQNMITRYNAYVTSKSAKPAKIYTVSGGSNYITLAYYTAMLTNYTTYYTTNGSYPAAITITATTSTTTTDTTATYRPVMICSDNINGTATDKARINNIITILKAAGLTASNFGLGPNTHITILQSSKTASNALVVDIFGGSDAGMFYEMGGTWFKKIRANRKVFIVLCCGAKSLTGLTWLERAHDDNYSAASFTGLANPLAYLNNNGYDVLESSVIATIAAKIIEEAKL